MPATLKTIEATIEADGTVHLAEPVHGPAIAVVTVLIDAPALTTATSEAMHEPLDQLPRFRSVEALLEELGC